MNILEAEDGSGKMMGAEAVLKKVPLCRGCWDKSDIRTQCCAECGLRACCEEKQLYNCGECGDFPCEKYIEFVCDFEHHKKAMEYLLSLKQARKGEET